MSEIRAFVGHSFLPQDEILVRVFTDYFDTLKRGAIDFDWSHATEARPEEVSAKVLELIEGKNLFIGICTKNERATKDGKLSKLPLGRRMAVETDLEWKTSDWIIQEIGLSIGRGMRCCLLVERGVRKPGGLQGNLEYIEFDRSTPEKSFPKIFEMISALKEANLPVQSIQGIESATQNVEGSQANEPEGLLIDPDPSWGEEKFREQLTFSKILKNTAHASKIVDAFQRSPMAKQEDILASWNAFCELQAIRWGEHASLERLKGIAKKNSENVDVLASLARAYAHFKDAKNAEEFFRSAITHSDDQGRKIGLLGELADLLQASGLATKVETVVAELRGLKGDTNSELKVLTSLSDLSSWYKDDILKVAIYERRLAIDPTDIHARFQLAYHHSQMGNESLAMHHYEKIPNTQRDGYTWNNLGVVYRHFSLPARSVSAYQCAIEKKETLAMANVAYLYIGAGFTQEARELLDKAQKEPNYHKSVVSALSKLNDVEDDEEKLHAAKLEGVSQKSALLARFGELLLKPNPTTLPLAIVDDKCELVVERDVDYFFAAGSYKEEKSQKSATGLFGAIASAEETFHVTYKGRLFGALVVGERTIERSGSTMPISFFGIYPIKSQFLLPLPGKSEKTECLVASQPQVIEFKYSVG